MYFITLTTDEELTDDEFQEVFGLLDNSFDVGTVLTFSADGEKIETVATMSTKHDKYLYEFDVANKIATAEGDNVVLSLAKVVACDFELDAPIIEEECSMKIKDVEEAVDPEELKKALGYVEKDSAMLKKRHASSQKMAGKKVAAMSPEERKAWNKLNK